MASAEMAEDLLEETIRRIERALDDGHAPPHMGGGAVMAAARQAVVDGFAKTDSAFRSRYDRARSRLREPDWTRWRAPVYQRPGGIVALDSYRIVEASKPTGSRTKFVCIGDAHDDPRMPDKDRFLWLGRWASEMAPDHIVQIGDWATFDSMSTHAAIGSQDAIMRPSWPQDLESLHESINTFEKGLGGGRAKKVVTEGNHEKRVARYENANPNIGNALTVQWRSAFRDNGWTVRDFAEYYFIEGVGFIHHMVNAGGRAFGGKTANQRAGNDLTFSVIHGHDHKREIFSSAKIGPVPEVSVISVGCALPWGWVEPYAQHGTTGWWAGAMSGTIQDGMITDINFISMLDLEDRYADKKRSTSRRRA